MYLLVSPIEKFNPEYVYYNHAICKHSNIIFYRIYYSTSLIAFDAVYLQFTLLQVRTEPYFNKLKCIFNTNLTKNQKCMELLNKIETQILEQFHFKDNTNTNSGVEFEQNEQIFKLSDQLKEGNIKLSMSRQHELFKHNLLEKMDIVIKISGMWENNSKYGLTYHFYTL